MYHIRIDYYDHGLKGNQTLFDYDYQTKESVIETVIVPYLNGVQFLFAGANLTNTDIRKVTVYSTQGDIKTMKEIANENVSSGVFLVYGNKDVLDTDKYAKDITREITSEANHYIQEMAKSSATPCTPKPKRPLLFISHSSANEEIAKALVDMLRTLGFNKKNLFCSSVPGYDIPEGEDIYNHLASKFNDYNIFVIFLLSHEYYQSAACLNEMGATWVLKANYSTLVCPGFSIPEIKGAVNPTKMAVVLEDKKRVNGKLNQLKDRLVDFFDLPDIEDDTIWENDRNKFIESL